MKKLKWILPLFVLTIMLSGCPYGNDLPIDKPAIKVNPALFGKWTPKSLDDEYYLVSKQDEFSYKVVKQGKNVHEQIVYTGYLSIIDTTTFLNLQGEPNNDKKYYFYKVEISPSANKLTLTSVTDNITDTFASSEDLKAFFKKYQSLSFFFVKDKDIYFKD